MHIPSFGNHVSLCQRPKHEILLQHYIVLVVVVHRSIYSTTKKRIGNNSNGKGGLNCCPDIIRTHPTAAVRSFLPPPPPTNYDRADVACLNLFQRKNEINLLYYYHRRHARHHHHELRVANNSLLAQFSVQKQISLTMSVSTRITRQFSWLRIKQMINGHL